MDLAGDSGRYFALQNQHVFEFSAVTAAPDGLVLCRVNQPDLDAYAVPGAKHGTFREDVLQRRWGGLVVLACMRRKQPALFKGRHFEAKLSSSVSVGTCGSP